MSTEVVEDQTAGGDPVSPVPQERKRADSESAEPTSPEIHFEPIVTLPIVDVSTLEEDEKELFKIRAKLYRYDTSEDPPEFKERGTGDVKLLKHRESGQIRILMRRDKTLKICANHHVVPRMELKKHNNSDKVFVWSTLADYVDDVPKAETLAIRFGSVENAQKFKEAFESAKKEMTEMLNDLSGLEDRLEKTNLGDDEDENESDESDASSDENNDNKENEQNEERQVSENATTDK